MLSTVLVDLERRPLDFQEKKYLLDIEAVTETQCNMGQSLVIRYNLVLKVIKCLNVHVIGLTISLNMYTLLLL